MSSLSKGQRRRRNEKLRRQQDALWLKTVGPLPEYFERFFAEIEPNLPAPKGPRDRAPLHVIDTDEFRIDKEKLAQLSARAATYRSDDCAETISAMRQEFPYLWGVRGEAKTVANEWFARSGQRVSLRTIQNYFKITRG